MTTLTDLRKQVDEWVKANRWSPREQLLKGMLEDQFLQKHDVTEAQVRDIVANALWPGEKRKGNVHYTQSVRGDAYYRIGAEYPMYKVESVGYGEDETYRVTRYSEPTGKFGRPMDDEVKVLIKNVPKSWAVKYTLNRLDPSQPKPEKLVGRELMQYGKTKAKVVTDIGRLLDDGVPSKGFDVKDLGYRPVFLYKGAENNVITDGFLLIHDKDAANRVLEGHVDKLRKAQYDLLRKSELSTSEAEAGADQYIQEQRVGTFPKWRDLVPETVLSGWEPVGTSIGSGDDQVAWFQHPGSGKMIAVNVDKLAYIYKQVPGIDKISSGAFSPARNADPNTHSGPLVFYEKGEVKALLMPMFFPKVPEKIMEAAGFKIVAPGVVVPPVERPAITFTEIYRAMRNRSYTDKKRSLYDSLQEILSGYRDDEEAREDATVLRTTGGRRYSPLGYEIGSETIEKALEVRAKLSTTQERQHQRWLNEQLKSGEISEKTFTHLGGVLPAVQKVETGESEVALQTLHDDRSQLSKSSDERQEHSLIIEPDDPRVSRWRRNPGTMDVRGIDTPRKRTKKPARKSRRTTTETTVRRLR